MGKVETYVRWMEKIAADDSHGYDQEHRNGPDYDCSSLVGTALKEAGLPVSASSTTRNLRKQLLAAGFKSISTKGSRRRGDIFLKEGKHVVVCTDSAHIVHARKNEKGGITGGKTGDQTGGEIAVTAFYTYSGGWDYCFRYEEGAANNTTSSKGGRCTVTTTMPILSKGKTGSAVKVWQTVLCAAGYEVDIDSSFGPDCEEKTIAFEKAHGITNDPQNVGPKAWAAGLAVLE